MIQIDVGRTWGIPDFTLSEGKIISSSANFVWCEKAASVGEFVLVVQGQGRADAFVMHPKCLHSEVKAARNFAIGLAQVQESRPPRRAWPTARFADRRSGHGVAAWQ